jgi:hypothetical protein
MGTDPARATQEFRQLVRPLVDTSAPTSDGRELTYVAATDGLLSALYDRILWPQATAGLVELRQGRGDSLMALRDNMRGRLPDVSPSGSTPTSDGAEVTSGTHDVAAG